MKGNESKSKYFYYKIINLDKPEQITVTASALPSQNMGYLRSTNVQLMEMAKPARSWV